MAGDSGQPVGSVGNGVDGNAGGSGSGDFRDKIGSIFADGAVIAEPTDAASHTADGPNERKRGGKRGPYRKSGSTKTAGTPALDLAGVEKLLLSIHLGLAWLSKVPEFALDDKEAHSMAEAVQRVARHYPILDKISDKAVDHANLFSTLGAVYGSRFMAYKIRTATEKAARPDNVTPLHPGHGRTN